MNLIAILLLLHYNNLAYAASYAVTLNRAVPPIGDFDCGQTDSNGQSRNFCITCAPTGGVRAVAAACDATPGCVAFDMRRSAARCAYLKSVVPRVPEGLQAAPGYTHYCKLDGSGRCTSGEFLWKPGVSIPSVAGNDMTCAAVPGVAPNPFCGQCHNETLTATGGLCSVCGVDRMLQACAVIPSCDAVEYAQSDSCGRVKIAAGPLAAADEMNLYIKIGRPIASAPAVAAALPAGGK